MLGSKAAPVLFVSCTHARTHKTQFLSMVSYYSSLLKLAVTRHQCANKSSEEETHKLLHTDGNIHIRVSIFVYLRTILWMLGNLIFEHSVVEAKMKLLECKCVL